MFLTLPDSGAKVKIWVQFFNTDRRLGTYRHTKVAVFLVEEGEKREGRKLFPLSEGRSSCSPLDNFSRLMGRRLACNNLLSKMKQFSKADRRAIFDAVCPTYKRLVKKTTKSKGV